MNEEVLNKPKRSCDGCTKCCEGWLSANIYGEDIKPGSPCRFLEKTGCGIYRDRPKHICEVFKCCWLKYDTVPRELKPDKTNVIMVEKKWTYDRSYFVFIQCGDSIDPLMYSWMFRFHGITKNPIVYIHDKTTEMHGTEEFIQFMKEKNGKGF